jgi:microcystin-dependent protein
MSIVLSNQDHVFSRDTMVIGKNALSSTKGLTVYGNISANGGLSAWDIRVNDIIADDAKIDQLTANSIFGPALTSINPSFKTCYNGIVTDNIVELTYNVGIDVNKYLVFINGESKRPGNDFNIISDSNNVKINFTVDPPENATVYILGLAHNGGGSLNQLTKPPLSATDFAPIGTVMYFARTTPPPGWLLCDGSDIDKNLYPDLALVIGTTFGGTTTNPKLPELRGEFIRGWSSNRADVDIGRQFGKFQSDEFKSHTHLVPSNEPSALGAYQSPATYGGSYRFENAPPTSAAGGIETRPRNVALLPCIKAFHSFTLDTASINIGTITNSYLTKTTYEADHNFMKKEDGYQKLPGGVMLQWGKISDSSNSLKNQAKATFNFNTPFYTSCFSFNATIINKDAMGASSYDNFVQVVSSTKSTFTVLKQEAYDGNDLITEFNWFAVGDWK